MQRGGAGPDGKSILAASVIAMKKADLAAKRAHDQAEWTRHGIGGLVSAVDPAAGTITVSTSALGASKSVVVKVSKSTVLRRYAPLWLVQCPGLVSEPELERLQRQVAGATPARMQRELAQALDVLAADAPLVLVLEDLQ